MRKGITIIFLSTFGLFAQHNNEFYNDGALVHVQAGAEVHVWGDVHMYQATGDLENYGLIKMQGNAYSDNLFQQSGTGTFRVQNNNVNMGERQFISGSYAVRGNTAQIGVNDGSFYDLELANDQGIVYLVGTGNIADVRNSVDFWYAGVQNRIVTHDVGMLGGLVYPANGSNYTGVFGMMNPAPGIANYLNNTISLNGNMSNIDAGYIQGKHRRAVLAAGGNYGFIEGLEPAGAGAQRGVQYIRVDLGANNYDILNSYFETASPNVFAVQLECSGNTMNYFGGADHGEWMFQDYTTTGTGTYAMNVWPQDDNYIVAPIWGISKDNSFQGTANDCGPSPVGLQRTAFNGFLAGFSEFDVVAPISALPIELIDIHAVGVVDHIDVTWNVSSEVNLSHYELERSEDGTNFTYLSNIPAIGVTNGYQTYLYNDYDVRYFQPYYYRVKSVDLDGSYDYTPIVVASIERQVDGFSEDAISAYPNPTEGDFMLSIISEEDRDLEMNIYNMLGQVVDRQNVYISAGNTVMKIHSEEWAQGVYNIELRDVKSDKTINKRIIKH